MSGEINKRKKSGRGKSKKADIVTETENGFHNLSGSYLVILLYDNPAIILPANYLQSNPRQNPLLEKPLL